MDSTVREGMLEWIQVLPEFRRRKLGQVIVVELLNHFKNQVDFVTVSGKYEDENTPELLYRKCGFAGNDIWHILNKVNRNK